MLYIMAKIRRLREIYSVPSKIYPKTEKSDILKMHSIFQRRINDTYRKLWSNMACHRKEAVPHLHKTGRACSFGIIWSPTVAQHERATQAWNFFAQPARKYAIAFKWTSALTTGIHTKCGPTWIHFWLIVISCQRYGDGTINGGRAWIWERHVKLKGRSFNPESRKSIRRGSPQGYIKPALPQDIKWNDCFRE